MSIDSTIVSEFIFLHIRFLTAGGIDVKTVSIL
jgi:hypothetical protein